MMTWNPGRLYTHYKICNIFPKYKGENPPNHIKLINCIKLPPNFAPPLTVQLLSTLPPWQLPVAPYKSQLQLRASRVEGPGKVKAREFEYRLNHPETFLFE